ncbi:MAG: protein-glutamate O-methyltransferase CheR [bacterium]|nr:protein-glutamate O-methyltransferase CheR [bacterium]
MTSEQFNFLRCFLKEQSGLVLGEDKRYLLDSRLDPVAREFGFEDLAEMVVALKRPGSQKLATRITEAMTINESFFFRDMTPFDNFRKTMLPHMLEERANTRRLRIWSAAASTGQEGYSLAIELLEQKAKIPGWKIEILGTDLSSDALAKATAGKYSQFEVQRGMPTAMLMKYFKQDGVEWVVEPAVKSMVSFRHFNLLKDYRSLGSFDIVFCRNVLIYFDRDTKSDILNRMAKQMAPDGYLVLGAAETIIGLSDEFEMVSGARGLYQRCSATGSKAKPVSALGGARKAVAPTALYSKGLKAS